MYNFIKVFLFIIFTYANQFEQCHATESNYLARSVKDLEERENTYTSLFGQRDSTGLNYLARSDDDLKRRQDTVSKQLSEHNFLNKYNGEKEPFFYKSIQKYEERPFVPTGGFPSITHDVNYWYKLNKDANHAKHNWNDPMPSDIDYAPKVNSDLKNYIRDDDF